MGRAAHAERIRHRFEMLTMTVAGAPPELSDDSPIGLTMLNGSVAKNGIASTGLVPPGVSTRKLECWRSVRKPASSQLNS